MPREIQIAKWCVGRTHRALGELEEALEKEIAAGDGEPDGFVYEELGECLLALKRDGHKAWFKLAHAALSKDPWFVKNESERLARLEQLGK